MSTTAQDEATPDLAAEEAAQEAPTAPAAAAAPEPAPTTPRSYVLFEEARTDTWTKLGEVEAASQEAALESLGDQKLKTAQGRFMAIPSRFVQPRKPKVETQTTISFD
jgi:hypothetical protein